MIQDVPIYDEIGRTPVYNAPFCHEQDVEKARWGTHVRDCLGLVMTLQLASEDKQRTFFNDPVELLHHAIVSLAALSWSITHLGRVAIDRRLDAKNSGTQPPLAETELKPLKNKDTLQQMLRNRSTISSYYQQSFFETSYRWPENGKGKRRGKSRPDENFVSRDRRHEK